MGIQDKLSNSSAQLKRKLFDYKIFLSGTEHEIIRLKTVEDKYGDETLTILSNDRVSLVIDIPSDLPLSRLRTNVLQPVQGVTENIFLYDILPIEGFSRFQDNIEKGDILIKGIRIDNNSVFYLVLRVSEVMGSIRNNTLTWRKWQCSPYNMILPLEVQTIIDEYKDYF